MLEKLGSGPVGVNGTNLHGINGDSHADVIARDMGGELWFIAGVT
ncbi:hypothetical protein [Streptomyces sp. NPDC086766]